MRQKLTKSAIDGAMPGQRDAYLWDTEVPGFGVRIRSEEEGGARSFLVRYRHQGRQRQVTLGKYGALTLDQARRLARRELGKAAAGEDPAAARKRERKGTTVRKVAERFIESGVGARGKRLKTASNYRRAFEAYICPKIGDRLLTEVMPADVKRLRNGIAAEAPIAANRTLAALSAMYSWAAEHADYDGLNPVRGIKRESENRRERYLDGDETARLGRVLAAAVSEGLALPVHVAALKLIVLTGARKGEVLRLRWADVDLEGRCLRLGDTKTGASVRPLGEPAVRLLEQRPRESAWVFPAVRDANKPLRAIDGAWRRIREEAGIPDVRVHDLRHTFGARAAGFGLSDRLNAGMLGHRSVATTERYAHLAPSPLVAAADAVAGILEAELRGDDAEVLELKR